MASLNFEFLRPASPTLADTAALAERYWHGDPQSAAVKLRTFAEAFVGGLFAKQRFPKPYNADLNDLLREHAFVRATPRVIVDHLHLLRKLGNKGAHGQQVTTAEALRGLEDAFAIARWIFLTHLGGSQSGCPQRFQPPPPESVGRLEREKKRWQAERELEEARLAAALEEAERERARLAAAVEAAEACAALSEAELEKARSAGDRVATNVLGLSEAETRARLIDADLAAAGWDVGVDGQSTDEVGQEVPVTGLPQGSGTGGKSGSGLVDYVLLAVT